LSESELLRYEELLALVCVVAGWVHAKETGRGATAAPSSCAGRCGKATEKRDAPGIGGID
jgi:hypothetical protein